MVWFYYICWKSAESFEHMLDLIRSKSYSYNALWTWHLMINWLLFKTDFEFQKLTCHKMTELWHVSDLLLADSLLLSFTFLFQIIRHSGCLDPKKNLSTIDPPPGVPGVSKNHIFFSQMKLFSFCAKIAPKRHKLQKSSKL